MTDDIKYKLAILSGVVALLGEVIILYLYGPSLLKHPVILALSSLFLIIMLAAKIYVKQHSNCSS